MQAVKQNQTCPLCRREANGAAREAATRLCPECQSLIAPISPTASLRPDSEAATAGHVRNYPSLVTDQPAEAEPVSIPEEFDLLEQDPAGADIEFVDEVEMNEGLAYPDLELALDAPDEQYSDLAASAPAEAPGVPQPETFYHESTDNPAGWAATDTVESFGHGIEELGTAYADEPGSFIGAESAPAESAAAREEPSGYASATDPWDNPLPAWDHSHNEWPVLLAPKKQSRVRSLRVPIVAALVLAFGAVVYFLFFQPGADSARDKVANVAQKPLVVTPPATAEPAQSQAAQPQAEPARPAENNAQTTDTTKQPAAAPEGATGLGDGRFSLQVASMPDRAGAEKMAADLKATGLPAYVVAADLGKRGIWHRVRVGRFATAEEAGRFAASSHLRADVTRD